MQNLNSKNICDFHDDCLAQPQWANLPPTFNEGLWQWIETNHRNNFLLWDEEDLARRRNVPDSAIAINKRNIDGFNQKRNDAVERVDDLILLSLGTMNAEARLNAETAGMMIDRLSILSLKVKAMRLQTERKDVDAAHIATCAEKLARLNEQRADLSQCLDALLADCRNGTARYKIYRQFKMYNDPALNPQLYANPKK